MHHSVSATSLSVLVVLLALSFLAGQGHAQVLFEDDFEACSCALRLACQDSTHWDTWSSSPCDTIEDPCVTNIVAFSGVNSVWIRQGNDLIHPIPAYTDGKYRISFRLLIPSGFTASWGQLAEFVSPPRQTSGASMHDSTPPATARSMPTGGMRPGSLSHTTHGCRMHSSLTWRMTGPSSTSKGN